MSEASSSSEERSGAPKASKKTAKKTATTKTATTKTATTKTATTKTATTTSGDKQPTSSKPPTSRPTRRKTNQSGAETKERILDAALDVVRADGMIGVSARNIARQGGVNQALVFYHFGSVEELMVAALERAGNRRMARYRDRLEAVTTFSDLVAIAADLHAGPDDPDSPALAAIVAAWSTSSDLGPRIVELLQPWNDLLAAAIRRALVGSPLAPIVPADELAHGIAALFLGIEVLDRLDPTSDMTGRLFTALQAMATMVEPTLAALQSLDSSSSDG